MRSGGYRFGDPESHNGQGSEAGRQRSWLTGPLQPVVYARHGRELMGCKSPVGEPKVIISSVTTSLRQGRLREEGSEGSRRQDPRADEQKRHKRPSIPGEPAPDGEALGSGGMVNGAVVRGQLTFLSGEICSLCGVSAMGNGLRPISKGMKMPPVPKATTQHGRRQRLSGEGRSQQRS